MKLFEYFNYMEKEYELYPKEIDKWINEDHDNHVEAIVLFLK